MNNNISVRQKAIIITAIIVLLTILLIIIVVINNEQEDVESENNVLSENETEDQNSNGEVNNVNTTNTEKNETILNEQGENEIDESEESEESEDLGDFSASNNYSSVISPTTFYTVKGYIDDFFNCIANFDDTKLLNLLDENYLNENSIDISNINDKLEKYVYSYKIKDISEYAYSDDLRTFLAEIDFDDNNENVYVYYALDYSTGAYKIYISEGNTKGDYINEKNIEENDYNQFVFTTVSNSTMCENYLNMFTDEIQSSVRDSYYLLDKTYRTETFSNINEYVSYINENIDMFLNAKLSDYKVVINSDNSMEYTIIDNYGNYYIIYATSVMNYTIILSK